MARFLNIPEYPRYFITDNGRVWSLRLKRFMKDRVSKHRYNRVVLYNKSGNKSIFVHRIVASVFLGYNGNKSEVNHIDGNKLNNSVENLEWCTHSENMYHAYNVLGANTGLGTRKTEETIEKIRESKLKHRNIVNIATGEIFATIRDMAESYGYTYNAILATILNKKNKVRGLKLREEGRS